MPVALHVPADDGAVEHVQGGEQRGGAVPLVVVRHGAGAALLHRQAGLGAVERLDLALLVDRQHDGMGGRIDVEPDHVAQLVGEVRVVGELELLTRCGARPWARQMRCTEETLMPTVCLAIMAAVQWVASRGGSVSGQRHHARRPPLAPSGLMREGRVLSRNRPSKPASAEALLPAPDAGLRLAGAAHDLDGAEPVRRQQDDLGPPDVLLRRRCDREPVPPAAAVEAARRRSISQGACARTRMRRPSPESPSGFNCQMLSTRSSTERVETLWM